MGNKDILKKTTAVNLMLRLFIGGFLIYMAYDILTSLDGANQANVPTLIGFSILFIVCGLIIGGLSLTRLIKHQYYDPTAEVQAPVDASTDVSSDVETIQKISQEETEKE